MANPTRPSLRDFDPYADRNGQTQGQDDARDVADGPDLQRHRDRDPAWEAELVRQASDGPRQDSLHGGSISTVEATEAETPPETLRHLGDASTRGGTRGRS